MKITTSIKKKFKRFKRLTKKAEGMTTLEDIGYMLVMKFKFKKPNHELTVPISSHYKISWKGINKVLKEPLNN